MLAIIIDEKKLGNKIVINTTGQQSGIQAYIIMMAAIMTDVRLVTIEPELNDELQIVSGRDIEIPVLPILLLSTDQMKILTTIGSGVDSIERLVLKMYPEVEKNNKDYNKNRSRVAYHLDALDSKRFIIRTREGKVTRVELTGRGKMYMLLEVLKERYGGV